MALQPFVVGIAKEARQLMTQAKAQARLSCAGSARAILCDGRRGSQVMQVADAGIEAAKRRERGGRVARRELRSHGSQGHGRPYIVRNIPTYDILSEENLRPHRGNGGPYPRRDWHRVPRRSGGARSLAACRRQGRRRAGQIRAGHAARTARGQRPPASPSMRAIPPIPSRSAARASCSRRPTARPSSWISIRAAATARSRISAIS